MFIIKTFMEREMNAVRNEITNGDNHIDNVEGSELETM